MSDVEPIRLILSGGIGSGKSTVARAFEARGVPVFHADEIGHLVLEPEGEAATAVGDRWPRVVVGGHIDRERLASIVFANPVALGELESMTHPAIAARLLNLVERDSAAPLIVVELPVLVDLLGEGWGRVIVYAPVEVRRERLRERGMDPDDIAARMAAQPDQQSWMAMADHVIDNSGDLAELDAEVERLLLELGLNGHV